MYYTGRGSRLGVLTGMATKTFKDCTIKVYVTWGEFNIAKGQLISKCPFGVIVSTKIPTKKFDNFCPRFWKVVKSSDKSTL